jgi:type VI secretion system protein ImpH
MDARLDPDIQFFRLAQDLERLHPDAPPLGSTAAPHEEAIRFRANPTLAFPAGEVEWLRTDFDQDGIVDVCVNLIGLYGPASPLPTIFTERVIDPDKGGAVGDFLDLFNHRLAALLVVIWKHYRHDLRYQAGASDPLSLAVGSLFGSLPRSDAADPDRVLLLPYAGLLAMESRSAESVARILTHCLGLPCRIEEFVPRRIQLPPEARFTLGAPLALGVDTLAGDTIEDVTGKCRIWIGPMSFERFCALLPDGPEHAAADRLIDTVIREPLVRDLGLTLAEGEAPAWALGHGKLGWSTWADAPRGAVAVVT